MKIYLGITIGPNIVDTLTKARKTKDLWITSYIFSYIIENLFEKIIEKGNVNFIYPYYNKSIKNGVGIYPNRAIIDITNNISVYDELQAITDNLFKELAESIKETLKNKNVPIEIIEKNIKNYFKIYYLKIELEKLSIIEIQNYLDTLELTNPIAEPYKTNYLLEFFEQVECDNFLFKKAFDNCINKFPYLVEISTKSLFKNNKNKQNEIFGKYYKGNENTIEDNIFKDLLIWLKNENRDNDYKKYHKYIAIVQADGDNIREIVKKLKEDSASEFSAALQSFSEEASNVIKKYGGVPIYIGGDDLLFFSPVKGISIDNSKEDMLIFDLLNSISNLFNKYITEKFKNIIDNNKKPSLSFGVSINYIKHSLSEALKKSREQLFDIAKKQNNKNNIAVNVEKHSGQRFYIVFNRNADKIKFYNEAMKLLKSEENDKYGLGNFIHSAHHKVDNQKIILKEIMKITDKEVCSNRLKHFFENIFNEEDHKKKFKYFLEYLRELIEFLFKEMNEKNDKNDEIFDENLNTLNALMRLNLLLKAQGAEKD